jgi:hypothetical protein
MNQEVSIFKSKPILFSSLSLLVLLSCSYHLLNRFDYDLSVLIGLAASVFFLSLAKEIKIFLIGSLRNPGKNFLILCILFFSLLGIFFYFENIAEIGLFVILFFSIYLVFKNQDKNLNNFLTNLMIYSGIFMSIGVLIGFLESLFLSSQFFYHVYDGYPYVGQKLIYSGFGFNHNFSAYIIVVAQSFLFLSKSIFIKNLRLYLTTLFLLSLIITTSKIAFLFIFLIICNYLVKKRKIKNIIIITSIAAYLFLSHIVFSFNESSELGTTHYRELLFSVGRMDVILGFHGHLKAIYFIELLNNFFLPVSLKDVSLALGYDPHCLIYSLMILGGFPLALSVLIFIVLGVFKNFKIIEERYPIYYYCGLICVFTEMIIWDANNSIFFWVIILYAITISKDSDPPSEAIIDDKFGFQRVSQKN